VRTYGRVPVFIPGTNIQAINANGLPETQWIEVDTTADGYNDYVYMTTMIQTIKLNLGESPFYGNYGIPAKPSIVSQVAPDFYVMRLQQQFAQFFASLTIARTAAPAGYPPGTPTYQIAVTTQQGFKLSATVPIAT
jgi:hypothetical protein